jgi:hypothetical protein
MVGLPTRVLGSGARSFVIQAFVALKAGRQPRRIVRIGNITGRTWHAGPAAPASLVAAPRAVIVRLANPIGIPTTGAFHAGFMGGLIIYGSASL